MNAPEQVGLNWTGRDLGLTSGNTKPNIEYIRADLAMIWHPGAPPEAMRDGRPVALWRKSIDEWVQATCDGDVWWQQYGGIIPNADILAWAEPTRPAFLGDE